MLPARLALHDHPPPPSPPLTAALSLSFILLLCSLKMERKTAGAAPVRLDVFLQAQGAPLSSSASTSLSTKRPYTNKPEERASKISKRLQELLVLQGKPSTSDGDVDHFDVHDVAFPKAKAEKERVMSAIARVHDDKFLRFLEQSFMEWEKSGDKDHSDACGYLVPYHRPPFTGRSPRINPVLWLNVNLYATDMFTPIAKDTFSEAFHSVACAIAAADHIAEGKTRYAYALTIHPGHHAAQRTYGGYCYINNAAVAVRVLQDSGRGFERIAILDVDYHHGDGTQNIFWDDSMVFCASIHMDPRMDYPHFSGFEDEVGDAPYGGKRGHSEPQNRQNKGRQITDNVGHTNLNIPLPPGTKWEEKKEEKDGYRPALDRALRAIVRFNPDAVIVSFGADTVSGDPDSVDTAGMRLEVKDYRTMGETIRKELWTSMSKGDVIDRTNVEAGEIENLLPPVLVVQEGGYLIEKVADVLCNFLGVQNV